MKFLIAGLFCFSIALIVLLTIFIVYLITEKKRAKEKQIESAKKYNDTIKKENENNKKNIADCNPDNIINKLQDLSNKGNARRN